MTVEQLISDDEITKAFANSNFGTISRRDVIKFGVLKAACGFRDGRTVRDIISELGLINDSNKLTKRGKDYLWIAFAGSTFW